MPLAIAILPSPGFLTASPPSKQTTASQDQGRQACADDGTGNPAYVATNARDGIVETEPCSAEAAHRFTKRKLHSGRTSQQWDVDQVV